jgi:hypothetical protein
MLVKYCESEFEIPDILIDKFIKDFDALPGSAHRDGVHQIRESIGEVLEYAIEEPDLLEEPEYLVDFLRALAMRQAMDKLGILYDA